MVLEEASNQTFTFEVVGTPHFKAEKQAKAKVAKEHAIDYDYLTAKVIHEGGPDANALVTVALTPNR